jgi:arsenate reductase
MAMTVFHYKGCGTCKKALKYLDGRGIVATRIDLVATPPDAATLRDLWTRSKKPLERFFNTSGESYRAGGFKDRLPAMTDAQKLAALAADGKLIKRPLLDLGEGRDGDGLVLVGFREDEWANALP